MGSSAQHSLIPIVVADGLSSMPTVLLFSDGVRTKKENDQPKKSGVLWSLNNQMQGQGFRILMRILIRLMTVVFVSP